ncbi:enoyl-CoA hydratase/isomerase family protein [Actinophytocola oryzae]|uniref:enoyl-CoA hydratase n=1 Tax=Actinophytocola oryzae TaxID=502181 RepID=A0A4R7W180_9PSEU|nr:enoyl-CoA hydratase-related protein [Actinophytocola oryzae]TDV56214.1 short chain enoyl-CoA hydratase [Actinophytocola oryzae]
MGSEVSPVTIARHGSTAVITVDNPPVNAFHPDIAEAIAELAAGVGEDPDARALVITAAGRHFMAGGDIAYLKTLNAYRSERYVLRIQEVQDQLRRLPQPVIAAINGTALGGGLELALACDIRLAASNAVLGLPEVSLGIIPGAGGTQNLPRVVSLGQAKRLLFTADRITAAEALTIGLVDEVVPAGEVLTAALDLAARIARNAPLAVTAAKRAVDLGLQTGVVDGHRIEATLFAPLTESADFAEGIAAFIDKREPSFRRG